ncbi:jg6042 [Pararge aegeria aegeria]|uniref:Jg6042 protein n=1 Tax=Pararge aegeria aegeria TaxID=348720 RepID=A0A8S4QAY2_9NEOP|nr:jg6042 [Pararge aegeria aegeria]
MKWQWEFRCHVCSRTNRRWSSFVLEKGKVKNETAPTAIGPTTYMTPELPLPLHLVNLINFELRNVVTLNLNLCKSMAQSRKSVSALARPPVRQVDDLKKVPGRGWIKTKGDHVGSRSGRV